MLEQLTRHWWAIGLRGVLAVLFGLCAVVWPGPTIVLLAVLFGAYALADGVVAAISAVRARGPERVRLGLQAALGVVIGAAVLVWPQLTVVVLAFLVGLWAVVTGVFQVVAAVRLRAELDGEWLTILSGALSVLFGLLIWLWPLIGAVAIALVIGFYAIVFGGVLIALALRLRARAGRGAQEGGTGTV